MEENEIKQKCLELIGTVGVSYLGTIDDKGFPQIRAMTNLRDKSLYPGLAAVFEGHQDDFLVYMPTAAASAKFAHIEANPNVSVYFCDAEGMRTLLLIGRMEVVTDKDIKRQLWQDDWKIHFPDGVDGPEYNILRLLPTSAKCWFMPMPEPAEFKLN